MIEILEKKVSKAMTDLKTTPEMYAHNAFRALVDQNIIIDNCREHVDAMLHAEAYATDDMEDGGFPYDEDYAEEVTQELEKEEDLISEFGDVKAYQAGSNVDNADVYRKATGFYVRPYGCSNNNIYEGEDIGPFQTQEEADAEAESLISE